MKLLLVGNHTCGNRGDAAILRGLTESLHRVDEQVEIDIISRFPVSSQLLLGREVKQDKLDKHIKRSVNGLIKKIKKRISTRLQPAILVAHHKRAGLLSKISLPGVYLECINEMKNYDAIIQVGGSFFVDLYGSNQFEHALCALLAERPIYMIGHSVGPFNRKGFNEIADYVFSQVNSLILRENVSLEYMNKSNISTIKVQEGIDTAWLVSADYHLKQTLSYNVEHWHEVISKHQTVAITLRELAPFDKRLGVTQQEYEHAFARLVNSLTEKGYQVLALSTCTGIDRYNKDDRMIALNIKQLVKNPEKFHVVMDELNDVELGQIVSRCTMTIGTRLHSAIISMNFNTPAIAINYEHKSLGIMRKMGLDEMAVDIKELMNGSIIRKAENVLDNLESYEKRMTEILARQSQAGDEINKTILDNIKG